MRRPLVLIHGYSAEGKAFDPVRDALAARGFATADIDICSYISLNNEITIKDIAEGLDRAFRFHPVLKDDAQEFDAIVHSTGMLVLRSWLTNYGAAVGSNPRLKRLKHLIGFAPATWGSPQGSKGRTWLGALIKGDKQLGPDFLNAGTNVLDALELGSAFTWDLAHEDLLGPDPYYDKGTDTPFVAVFVGNQGYSGIESVANDPGTDGTVRWAGCALNTRKISIDLTRTPIGPDGKPVDRVTISPWADGRLDIPMIAVDGKNHGTILSEPAGEAMDLAADFLKLGDPDAESHDAWLARAKTYGDVGLKKMQANPGSGGGAPLDGWQQFVVHATDERGDGVSDYFIEILREEDGAWKTFTELYTDVHAYRADPSFRCFSIRLPQGMATSGVALRLRLNASTGTELMTYQGYGSDVKELTASSAPVELDIGSLAQQDGLLFYPFTTTLIEIRLNREPMPLDKTSRILGWFEDLEN
jgi:pimeloyl-ACP methyl ester carboxylesterase